MGLVLIVSLIGVNIRSRLVLTDIPRTGLSMRLKDFFPSPRPGVVLYHGPLDYPVVHVVREDKGSNESTRFTGRIDDTSISQLSIRSHKFDMASVPWRAMAKHLHVDSVPACLLYQAPCLPPYLRLEAVFAMLDDVYSKLQTRYFASKNKTMNALPVQFHTTAKWADRLHHVLGSFWWHREDKKLHIIHFFKPSVDSNRVSVCDPSQRRISRPLICQDPLALLLHRPSNQSKAQMHIAQHIELRFATLQSKYPSLELDLLVQTTRHGSVSAKALSSRRYNTSRMSSRSSRSFEASAVFNHRVNVTQASLTSIDTKEGH